jgi:hypothetical protein
MDILYAPRLDLAGYGEPALALDDPQQQVEPGGHPRRGRLVSTLQRPWR